MFRNGNALVVALVNLAGDRSRVWVMVHTQSFSDETLLLRPNRSPHLPRFARFNREPSPFGPDSALGGLPHPHWDPNFPRFTRGFCKSGGVCPASG